MPLRCRSSRVHPRRRPCAAGAVFAPVPVGSPVDVPIPELGAESIVEGSILSIAKKPGDYVAEEEMRA